VVLVHIAHHKQREDKPDSYADGQTGRTPEFILFHEDSSLS
jgi:hypothetical protein